MFLLWGNNNNVQNSIVVGFLWCIWSNYSNVILSYTLKSSMVVWIIIILHFYFKKAWFRTMCGLTPSCDCMWGLLVQ